MESYLIFLVLITLLEPRDCFLSYPASGFLLNQFFTAFNASYELADKFSNQFTDGENCVRKCKTNDRKICHFKLTLRNYQTMGGSCDKSSSQRNEKRLRDTHCVLADGIGRGFLAFNFSLPGPKIQVCKDDLIVVDLHNDAEGSSTSIHWHGLTQSGTPFMDGVPYLTQCPISYGEIFRYTFKAANEGTHFYHSHSGQQKADGAYGAFVVRGLEENQKIKLYDFDLPEHTMLVADWMHQNANSYMPGMVRRSSLSESILINGHGQFFNSSTKFYTSTPMAIFHVEVGKKYRFRLINAGFNICPFLMNIEDHSFTIISTGVGYTKPAIVSSLNIVSGERFDFVVDTYNRLVRDYWIHFRQLGPCFKNIQGFAVLRYHEKIDTNQEQEAGTVYRTPPSPTMEYENGTILNAPLTKENDLAITHLEDIHCDAGLIEKSADKTNYIFFETPFVPNEIMYQDFLMNRFAFTTAHDGNSFIATANNISFMHPSFALLLEPDRIRDGMFCDSESINKARSKEVNVTAFRCIHRIKFSLGSIVDLVLVNIRDSFAHPIHLHGFNFQVMDIGILPANVTPDEVKNGAIPKTNFKCPPRKDTISLPFPGYVRLRVNINNPGFWLLHCHSDWHFPIGMGLIIQAGELHEMKQPPINFPRCHNYLPDVPSN